MCCHGSICHHVPIVVSQNNNLTLKTGTDALPCFPIFEILVVKWMCEGDLLLLDNVPGLRTLLLTNLDLLHFFKETWYS